jgi:hypothetical protein
VALAHPRVLVAFVEAFVVVALAVAAAAAAVVFVVVVHAAGGSCCQLVFLVVRRAYCLCGVAVAAVAAVVVLHFSAAAVAALAAAVHVVGFAVHAVIALVPVAGLFFLQDHLACRLYGGRHLQACHHALAHGLSFYGCYAPGYASLFVPLHLQTLVLPLLSYCLLPLLVPAHLASIPGHLASEFP